MNIEKAQKRLVKAEKQIDKLHAGLEKQFGSDFGVDNAAYTEICQDVLEIKQARTFRRAAQATNATIK